MAKVLRDKGYISERLPRLYNCPKVKDSLVLRLRKECLVCYEAQKSIQTGVVNSLKYDNIMQRKLQGVEKKSSRIKEDIALPKRQRNHTEQKF